MKTKQTKYIMLGNHIGQKHLVVLKLYNESFGDQYKVYKANKNSLPWDTFMRITNSLLRTEHIRHIPGLLDPSKHNIVLTSKGLKCLETASKRR